MKLTIYTPTIGIKLIIAKYCINYCENNKITYQWIYLDQPIDLIFKYFFNL